MKKTYSTVLLFCAVLVSIYLIIGFIRVMPLRPQSIHQWAQCDRASVALNYSRENLNLFRPLVHNIENGTGITGMEFPVLNFVAGILYRMFGFHEALYRLLMLSIVMCGLLAGFRIGQIFLKNFIWSSIPILLMFLSPVLVYYTPNFLPDAASLGLILIAWYYFMKVLENSKMKWYVLLTVFSTLACLIKITSLISVIVMILVIFKDTFWSNSNKIHLNYKFLVKLYPLLIPIIATFAWYSYASFLSTEYKSDVFLLQFKPIESWNQFHHTLHEINKLWLNQYYSNYFYFLIAISFVIMIIFSKIAHRTLFFITSMLWVGNLCYLGLMANQFPEHDYYIITLLPALFFQLTTFITVIQSAFANSRRGLLFNKIVLSVLIVHSIWFSRRNFIDRYDSDSWMQSNVVFNNYYNITPFARSLGIRYQDRIISATDFSPDITLYLMDQKGVTMSIGDDLNQFLDKFGNKYKYLVLNNLTILNKTDIHSKLTFLGTKNNIYFYRIKKTGNR